MIQSDSVDGNSSFVLRHRSVMFRFSVGGVKVELFAAESQSGLDAAAHDVVGHVTAIATNEAEVLGKVKDEESGCLGTDCRVDVGV